MEPKPFKDLDVGDIFEDADANVAMKTCNAVTGHDFFNQMKLNAVVLRRHLETPKECRYREGNQAFRGKLEKGWLTRYDDNHFCRPLPPSDPRVDLGDTIEDGSHSAQEPADSSAEEGAAPEEDAA